ncbi:Sensor histidine kinase RcsC [Caballeronia sp. SBC1]|uniref:ATP-binding response regulator n=1 Tax=unclassified Caballeronia TaxID=2646786 RepID=UPI0013E12EE4|nr:MULTISPECIES: ATP-binding protein [unclassified Caballeronia]QIE23671.1 Sensor histidine kinase RcsC [Caballeronia sp. SBC2]QIN61562.1 Sensor histidine kinase RcsC [Caballeronia sp. SBC1]
MLHRILSTPISSNLSLVAIRDRSRQVGELFGLDNLQRTRFITAISEIARNAVQFAGGGTLTFLVGDASEAINMQCVVAQITDKGPGIANLDELLADASHGEKSLSIGIPGSRRMADGFFVSSQPGQGTTVSLEMFLPRDTPRLTTAQLNGLVEQLTRRKAQTPVEELERQNRDMLLALEELRRNKAELEDADARKNEFLAMLAHELRNPLSAISLSLEVAQRSAEPIGDMQAKTFAVIGRQTQHLSHMVNDLLDVSRLTRGKVELKTEIVRIETLIDGAVEMTAAEVARYGHRVLVEYPPEPVMVRVDPGRLKQVFSNIIHNAARYTSQADEIQIGVTVDDISVRVKVIDRGIGIDDNMLPRVFDLFAQASMGLGRQESGLGIGLTVVQRLVRDHSGTVTVESPGIGRGSTFVVELPRVHDLVPDAPETFADAHGGYAQRMLLVDDNEDSLRALEALLAMNGHECQTALDGKTALSPDTVFRPTVAIIDIGLPDMSGFDVALGLRERFNTEPLTLVALSGYATADFHKEAIEAGFDYYFAKPVPIDRLFDLLETLPSPKPIASL